MCKFFMFTINFVKFLLNQNYHNNIVNQGKYIIFDVSQNLQCTRRELKKVHYIYYEFFVKFLLNQNYHKDVSQNLH